jgi:hypothetical protein
MQLESSVTASDNDQPQTRVPSPPLTAEKLLRTIAVLGAISAAGGVVLHEIGVVAYELRLEGLGIPAALFPQSDALLVTQGYYAVTGSLLNLYKVLTEIIVIAVPAVLLAVVWWNALDGIRPLRWQRIDAHFARWSARAKKLLRESLLAMLIYLMIPLALLLATVVMIVPILVGEQAARVNVARELQRYRDPCAASFRCVTLTKADATKVEGYLMQASSTHLALHEPRSRRTLVIGRQPTDVLSTQIPSAKP